MNQYFFILFLKKCFFSYMYAGKCCYLYLCRKNRINCINKNNVDYLMYFLSDSFLSVFSKFGWLTILLFIMLFSFYAITLKIFHPIVVFSCAKKKKRQNSEKRRSSSALCKCLFYSSFLTSKIKLFFSFLS